jgi:hypothetical protein
MALEDAAANANVDPRADDRTNQTGDHSADGYASAPYGHTGSDADTSATDRYPCAHQSAIRAHPASGQGIRHPG